MERFRGTCVAIGGSGVLLRGPSGSGKSDLALRLIDAGCQLVADDYTIVHPEGGRLLALAPEALRGLLEVRGIGILRVDSVASVPLLAVVDLVAAEAIERMPEKEEICLFGILLPRFSLVAREASAVAKVRLVAGIASGCIMRFE